MAEFLMAYRRTRADRKDGTSQGGAKKEVADIPAAKYRKTYRKTLPDDAESSFSTVTVPTLSY